MSPLWVTNFSVVKQLLMILNRPSPKYDNHNSDLARGHLTFLKYKFPVYMNLGFLIKGISVFISRRNRLRGSMTVEAALVLPLFVVFFLSLGSAIEMIRLHGNLQLGLWDVGNRLSVYGAVPAFFRMTDEEADSDAEHSGSDEEADSIWTELSGVAFSYTYVKERLVQYLSKDYLKSSPLADGADSLHFLESDIWESEDTFEIVLTYEVAPLGKMSGVNPFRMANRYYGHLWNGYDVTRGGREQSGIYVYLAENGEVYHRNRECTHLKLSVQELSYEEMMFRRNRNGSKYGACEICCNGSRVRQVYITDEGDRYHRKRECYGLKRTVYYVPVESVSQYAPCSRCG